MSPNSSKKNQTKPDATIAHVSLPQAVHDVLRRRILNNELVASERLVETKLADEFSVSRTTLRSALRELSAEGLIEISSRRGCFVTRMSHSEIHELCFARFTLEAASAEQSPTWVTKELLSQIEGVIDEMDAAARKGDAATIVELDVKFHSLIVMSGSRTRISQLWQTLNGQMGSLMRSSIDGQGIGLREVSDRHRIILKALKTKKPELVREAIKNHYMHPDLIKNIPDIPK